MSAVLKFLKTLMAETRDLVPASVLVAVQFIGSEVNLSLQKKNYHKELLTKSCNY